MARLENASCDEILAQLERELELNVPEETDNFPMTTITRSTSKPKTFSPWATC